MAQALEYEWVGALAPQSGELWVRMMAPPLAPQWDVEWDWN